jgi:hypothetical protein
MQTKKVGSLDEPLAHQSKVDPASLRLERFHAPSQHFNIDSNHFTSMTHALFLAASRATHTSCYDSSMSLPVSAIY